MKHPDFAEFLDLIEGRLTETVRKKIEHHTKECPACSKKKEDAVRTISMMKAGSLYDAPEYAIRKAVALFPQKKSILPDWVLARLNFDNWMVPQAAGTRSPEKGPHQQIYLTEAYKIHLMLESGQIIGQLIPNIPDAEASGCLVEVVDRKRILNTTTTSTNGEFILSLPQGKNLQLKIHGDPESVLISL